MTTQARNILILIVAVIVLGALAAYATSNHAAPDSQSVATTTPVSATSTSTANTATPTAHTPSPVVHKPAPVPTPTPGNGFSMITQADNGKTVHVTQGSRFGIAMGDAQQWELGLDPQGIVTRVMNIATIRGEQGVYTATTRGTTKLTATGAPICEQGKACPQYLIHVEVTIVVD